MNNSIKKENIEEKRGKRCVRLTYQKLQNIIERNKRIPK